MFDIVHAEWGLNLFFREEKFIELVAYLCDLLYIEEIERCGNFPLFPWGRLGPLLEIRSVIFCFEGVKVSVSIDTSSTVLSGAVGSAGSMSVSESSGSGDANEMNLFGVISCCSMLTQA